MHPNSLLNLKTPNKEDGRRLGKLPKSPVQQALNRATTGKYIKNKKLLKAVELTPEEKVMGVKLSEKIKQFKKINEFYGTDNRWQCILGIQADIANFELQIAKRLKEGKSTLYYTERLAKLKIELLDRMFGKIDTMVNIQNNVESEEKMTLSELRQSILDDMDNINKSIPLEVNAVVKEKTSQETGQS